MFKKKNCTKDKIKIEHYHDGKLISQTEYEFRKYYDTTDKTSLEDIIAAVDDYLKSNEWN